TALGDIAPDEAGAASGSLSAVQQIAAGVGSAAVTSVYFGHVATSQVSAMTVSLLVVLAITALCLLAIPLLPRKAALLEH
ncbi:MAG: MFS transporter, partial [Actinomycetota bacterium]|nr:MFS transporter [Actinomycetota bacterium]